MKKFIPALLCLTAFGAQLDASSELATEATAEIEAEAEGHRGSRYGSYGYRTSSYPYGRGRNYSYHGTSRGYYPSGYRSYGYGYGRNRGGYSSGKSHNWDGFVKPVLARVND